VALSSSFWWAEPASTMIRNKEKDGADTPRGSNMKLLS
jgi:hypothetical protein